MAAAFGLQWSSLGLLQFPFHCYKATQLQRWERLVVHFSPEDKTCGTKSSTLENLENCWASGCMAALSPTSEENKSRQMEPLWYHSSRCMHEGVVQPCSHFSHMDFMYLPFCRGDGHQTAQHCHGWSHSGHIPVFSETALKTQVLAERPIQKDEMGQVDSHFWTQELSLPKFPKLPLHLMRRWTCMKQSLLLWDTHKMREKKLLPDRERPEDTKDKGRG